MDEMIKAGIWFGLFMALKDRADSTLRKLKKIREEEERRSFDGMDKLRSTRR